MNVGQLAKLFFGELRDWVTNTEGSNDRRINWPKCVTCLHVAISGTKEPKTRTNLTILLYVHEVQFFKGVYTIENWANLLGHTVTWKKRVKFRAVEPLVCCYDTGNHAKVGIQGKNHASVWKIGGNDNNFHWQESLLHRGTETCTGIDTQKIGIGK